MTDLEAFLEWLDRVPNGLYRRAERPSYEVRVYPTTRAEVELYRRGQLPDQIKPAVTEIILDASPYGQTTFMFTPEGKFIKIETTMDY